MSAYIFPPLGIHLTGKDITQVRKPPFRPIISKHARSRTIFPESDQQRRWRRRRRLNRPIQPSNWGESSSGSSGNQTEGNPISPAQKSRWQCACSVRDGCSKQQKVECNQPWCIKLMMMKLKKIAPRCCFCSEKRWNCWSVALAAPFCILLLT